MRRILSKMTLTLLAVAMAAGCADGMEDVNRVQPNHYDKSQFEGTWYFRQTFTEVPYEAYWIFEGLAGSVAKIRWEVQEKFLIAYSVSEPNPGANVPPASGTPSYQAVAAWPITSHFDIIREYNPATGEASNVIVENTSDRPWYERTYIRVDWSSSKTMSDYTFDNYITRVHLSGANHWIQPHEETDPDAAEITKDYISIVNAFDSWVPAGACSYFFGDNPNIDWGVGASEPCGPATVRVRSSFRKFDPSSKLDYEPVNFLDRKHMLSHVDMNGDGKTDESDVHDKTLNICSDVEAAPGGGLRCIKSSPVPCTSGTIAALASDPFYAQFNYSEADCEPTRQDYFSKFGFFRTEKIHYDRERGKTEEGREYHINRFNIWKKSLDQNGNSIPYADREVRPIVYYFNAGYPEDLFEAGFEVGRQWDNAFRETVAVLQGKSIEEVPTVFEVRPNSCSSGELEKYVAKKPGAKAIADRVIGGMKNLKMENMQQLCAALQHNLGFEWQKNGDLRYSFMYWVQNPTLIGLLGFGPSYTNPDTGELISGTAYVYGGAVDQSAATATDIIELLAGRVSEAQALNGDQIRESVRRNARSAQTRRSQQVPATFFEEMDRRMAPYREMPKERALRSVPPGHWDAKIDKLKALGIDKEYLLNDEALALLRQGRQPGTFHDGEQEQPSFFDLMSPKRLDRQREILQKKAEHHCILEQGMMDDSIIGLALEFDAAGLSRDEIFRIVREKIYIGVMLHEVGHTIGMRHNFAGSMDGLNYFDEFWEYLELPENPAAARASVSDQVAQRLDRCVERSNQLGIPTPTTLECLRASELKQSSIMDYGAKFNSDFAGLGKYDRAAVAFGYGNLIEVFENEEPVTKMQFSPATHSFFTDYKRLPEVYGGTAENFLRRKWVRYDHYQLQQSKAMVDRSKNLPRISNEGCIGNCDTFVDAEVPYKFCIDAFNGTLECSTWDEGGNQTEVIESAISRYENYYFLNAFRRGRTNWDANRYLGGMFSDLIKGTRSFQYSYYYNTLWSELGLDLDILPDLQVASAMALNHIGRILQTPMPGIHCEHADGLYRQPELRSDCVDGKEWMDIPLGVGRPQWVTWNDDYPHYQVESFGTYWERFYAVQALVWTRSLFIQEVGDPRTYMIGFYKGFQDEILRVLGGLATGELDVYGGHVEGADGPNPTYVPKPMIDFETFGTRLPSTDTRPVVAPAFSFEGREIALLLGMVFLTSTEDAMSDFRDFFAVVSKGSNEDFDIPSWVDTTDPDQYLEFTNPFSGVTYRSFANGRSPHFSYGFSSIKKAKQFHDDTWLPALETLQTARAAWEAAASPGEKETLLADYLDAEAKMKPIDQDMNSKMELVDRIRYWYAVTSLGF